MDTDAHRLRQEAEHWFARRRGGRLAPAQEAAFQAWRSRSEAHARAYADAQHAWERLGPLRESPLALRMAEELIQAGPARRREGTGPWRPLLLAACVAALAVVGVVRWWPIADRPAPVSYATGVGERRSETLEDGSRVVLNTDTALRVRFGNGRREIELAHGEAMFDVAHDAARPFTVAAGDGTVTALGTRFQVRALGSEVAITLLEGAVEVARATRRERQRLAPGQRARYAAAGGGIALSKVDPASALGWLQGRLEFDAMPLAEVVAEANRYSVSKLRLGDPVLADMPISGTFQAGDNPGIAKGLTAAFDLEVGRSDGNEIVLLLAR